MKGLLRTGAVLILFLVGPGALALADFDTSGSTDALGNRTRPSSPEVTGVEAISRQSPSGRDGAARNAVDFYGNEVTAAVATYQLDRTGALYELHSPQTEVAQLPPPKS